LESVDQHNIKQHRQQKVEKVGQCYLRGLSLSRGMPPPGKFLKNTARKLNLGAFEAKII